MINILNKNYISSDKTTLKEEIRKIFKYLRDSGEFPYKAPNVVFRKSNTQTSQANAQNVNLPTAHYDPNNDTIVILIHDGRFLRDEIISFLHELKHCQQNREGRLENIQTDNVTEDDNLDKLEREAYEYSGIWFRKYKDSQKKPYFFKEQIKPQGVGEVYEHLYRLVGEIQLNPERTAKIEERENRGKFTVGDIVYEYKIYSIQNPYNDGKIFYNVYFHPDSNPISKPLKNTTKENYIIILNTMYKIITDFVTKFQPDYIGISSFDNNNSKNYHAVYNNLAQHNFLPGYRRKNANMPFETEEGKGRFIVLQKKSSSVDETIDLSQYMRQVAETLTEDVTKYKIYCDLDNVLAGFKEGFKQIVGMSMNDYSQKYSRNQSYKEVDKMGMEFWDNLPWHEGGEELWNYIKKYNPIILTASPKSEIAREGKKKWIFKNISPTQEVIFSPSMEKKHYSGENNIIIDDKLETIYSWIEKGGIGIHYTNTTQVINKLKQLGL